MREISICSFRISCICFRFCLLFTNVLFCLVFQCTLPITHDVFDVFIGIFYSKTHSILVHCLFLNLSIEVYSGKKINKILSQVRWKSLRFGCGFSSFVSSNERVLFVSRNWILFVCYVFVPVLFFLRWTSTLIILNWTDLQWNQMQTWAMYNHQFLTQFDIYHVRFDFTTATLFGDCVVQTIFQLCPFTWKIAPIIFFLVRIFGFSLASVCF